MGQRVLKDNYLVSTTGHNSTHAEKEKKIFTTSLHDFSNVNMHIVEAPHTAFFQCAGAQSMCEFQDYCNHLYYIDGRCDCSSAWRKATGLALPVSA